MSGLALIAHALGADVSGCDRAETPYFAELREAGIEPVDRPRRLARRRGHRDGRLDRHPGRSAGGRGGRARALHRSELLEQAARLRRVIAVGGTHGKTTTTAMVAHMLAECGFEPGWAIGAELQGANAPVGGGGVDGGRGR